MAYMDYFGQINVLLRRVIITGLLVAIGTVSLPLRVLAAGEITPNIPPVQADPSADGQDQTPVAVRTAPAGFMVPWRPGQSAEVVERRAKTTGYRVARVLNRVPTTAYTSRPQETDSSPFITADGSRVQDGIVAANFLKFGTKIRIPELYGDKVFEVHDRMNARYWRKVDIWMEDVGDAREHGLRRVIIEVIEPIEKT